MPWINTYEWSGKQELPITLLKEQQMGEACWDFDLVLLFKDDVNGDLLWVNDAGCSCPSPFEWTDFSITDGSANFGLTRGTFDEFKKFLEEGWTNDSYAMDIHKLLGAAMGQA